jgi:hypothetical protein
MCPTCGGYFPYKRGTKGGRLYITPAGVQVRKGLGRYRYVTSGRPGPSTRSVRVYYPLYGGTWFRCPDSWHQPVRFDDWWGINSNQEHSRRTTAARPSTERPGRAAVEARNRARAQRHKARQSTERR